MMTVHRFPPTALSLIAMSFFSFVNITFGDDATALDSEALLAADGSLQHGYTRIIESKDSEEVKFRRFSDFIRHNPGKYLAGQAELQVMGYYFNNKKWDELIEAGKSFFAKYPSYISLHGRCANYLARITSDKKISEDIRKKAFEALLPNLKNESMALGYTRNYIAGLPMSAEDKYSLAKKAASACGASPGASDYLIGFLTAYASAGKTDILKDDDPVKECEWFIAFSGKGNAAAVEAEKLMLKLKSSKGDAKAAEALAELNRTEKENRESAGKIAGEITALIADGKYQDAVRSIGTLAGYPSYIADSSLEKFVAGGFAKMPSEVKPEIAEALFKVLPPGKNSGAVYNMLLQDKDILVSGGADSVLKAAACYFERSGNDYFKDFLAITLLTGAVERYSADPQTRLKTYEFASSALEKCGLSDSQAEYLFKKAKYEWDSDRNAAIASLRKAVSVSPGTASAFKSAWFLDILEGKGRIVQGPLARKPAGFSDFNVPATVSCEANVKAENPVDSSGGVYSLRRNDVKRNIVSAEGISASSGKDSALLAADGKDDTAWEPEKLPAAMMIPLQKTSTVNRITVKSKGAARFTVSLIGLDGKVLGRYERAWPFLDGLNSDTYWPGEDVTLNVLPVDNVGFVRLDLYDLIEPDGGIRDVKVFQSAYPGKASFTLAPVAVENGKKSMTVSWKADEPEKETELKADLESVRGYPLMRWFKPWPRRSPLNLNQVSGNAGIEFYGGKAELELSNLGGADWLLDGDVSGRMDIDAVPADQKKTSSQKYPLVENIPYGRHILRISSRALLAANDKFGQNNIHFSSLKVTGKAKASFAVRFGSGDKWSPWYALNDPSGSKIDIPANIGNKASYQLGIFFDTRSILAAESPRVDGITVSQSGNPANSAAEIFADKDKSFITENIAGVADIAAKRQVVVVYPKAGTAAEYEAAKRIADKGGLYLVSDDIGLNNYPGPALAVGTPLTNRYCRQLIARDFVWNDTEFLNNPNGYVGTATDVEKKADFYYVTADTPSGVVKAAERLLKAMPEYRKPKDAFRIFTADTLEMIYPWQFHTDRPSPEKFVLRMGRNDRRSIQAGIAFNSKIGNIKTVCSDLVSAEDSVIPAPEIRYVGFYEWVPFFGDLRLPDILAPFPVLPIPENTSTGIWMTFKTQENSKPGDYKGTVSISADGFEKSVPVELKILPVMIPNADRIDTLSYASVPYWYHSGTKAYDDAFRTLARNEADHSVSMLSLDPHISCAIKPGADGKPALIFSFDGIVRQMDIADEVYKKKNLPAPKFYCYSPRNLRALTGRFTETGKSEKSVERIFAEQLVACLKESGRFERFYLKVGDEPSDIAKWVELAKPFSDGGLRVTTAHSTMYKNIDVAVGTMSAWCPNYQHDVFLPFLQERKKAGDRLWWYCCGVPTTRITGKPTDNLPFYWLTAKWGFEGAHSYAALEPKESGSEGNDVPFRYDHGMSFRIVFLPDGSLLDSTRRELESEGIKDCLLIYSIKDAIAQLEKDGTKEKAAAFEEKLKGILESVVPYKYGYAQTPAEWEKARASLYSLSEEIHKK